MIAEDFAYKRNDKVRLTIEREMRILQAAASNTISPEFPETVRIKNISQGGLCVVAGTQIQKGVVIEAEILLRGHTLDKFKAYCQVVWSRLSPEDGTYETGLQFLGVKETDAMQLTDYIKTHYH